MDGINFPKITLHVFVVTFESLFCVFEFLGASGSVGALLGHKSLAILSKNAAVRTKFAPNSLKFAEMIGNLCKPFLTNYFPLYHKNTGTKRKYLGTYSQKCVMKFGVTDYTEKCLDN